MKKLINRFSYKRVKWFWIVLSLILVVAFAICLTLTLKTYQDFNTWKTINLY